MLTGCNLWPKRTPVPTHILQHPLGALGTVWAARVTAPLAVLLSHISMPLGHMRQCILGTSMWTRSGATTQPPHGSQVGCTEHGEGHLSQGAMGSVNRVKVT